jgi:energy-coupling factor transporter ATP-binding protein EcfA2
VTQFDRVEFADLLPAMSWRQGEHVSIIGPTGYGKTTIAQALLELRTYVAVIATKPVDSTLSKMEKEGGYQRIKEWPPKYPPQLMPKVLLWPKFHGSADIAEQSAVIGDALLDIFAKGRWCIYVDELIYLCKMLGLRLDLELIWQQGRELKISLVGCTQRPAWVPLELYSQATHLFMFRSTDDRDLQRLGGIGGLDPATNRRTLRNLRKYEALYINTASETVLVTKSPSP